MVVKQQALRFLCVFDGSLDFLVNQGPFLWAVHSPELTLVLNTSVVLPAPHYHIPGTPSVRESCKFMRINNMLGYVTLIS